MESNVTLIIVDCVDYARAKQAFDHCLNLCKFKDAKILTHFNVDDPYVVKIDQVSSLEEYSDFMIRRLGDYFSTSHVLIAQYDGFIVHPQLWLDAFLEYDYIGAPWSENAWRGSDTPEHSGNSLLSHDVGNGGFSLRSKKLYAALSSLNPKCTHPEDIVICQWERPRLEGLGIRFAPKVLAKKFSTEYLELNQAQEISFGQHGKIISDYGKWTYGF